MTKRSLDEKRILDVLWGATLMGGGGGGPLQPALELLQAFKRRFPEKEVRILLYEPEDMEPERYAGVTASMGAPTAIKNKDFFAITKNVFDALLEMAAKLDPPRTISYSYGVELGGFNTFVPILASLLSGIPFIDADGAGRAVPALNTLLLHINGFDTMPLVMADEYNNRLTIRTADPRDAETAEEICRNICVAFKMQAGVAGWMVTREDFLGGLPCGTVTRCEHIGHILRSCAGTGKNAFDLLRAQGTVECKCLTEGEVVNTENVLEKGFDYGKVHIAGGNGDWAIFYQNENLMIARNGATFLTLPDIICCYDRETGMPLTNADIHIGQRIVVGAIKADGKWWQNPAMFRAWEPLLTKIGYTGGNVPYGEN
jgi:DUF917 family protein